MITLRPFALAAIASLWLLTACRDKPLFEQLDSARTGITFNNQITDSDTLNILNYQYIYNGGGVGVGDFNGDQKPDMFFAGNQVSNKLYLNEGDMKFRDATTAAGLDKANRWCSGVSVVDINADGKLDVYLSVTLHKQANRRANLLYVNQGNDGGGVPRFREQAADYGIADTTFSTHSAFFDYDNDGDLDLYVLVDQIVNDNLTTSMRVKITDGSSPNTGRLYRNDADAKLGHPRFTDVSREAGILIDGFGLGINICDLNRDGWKDIYLTNDFITNDVVYINDGRGHFQNRAKDYFKHTSFAAMGNDVADINRDGLADLVSVDMLPEENLRKKSLMNGSSYFSYQEWKRLGYEHQYVRNTLQLSQGYRPDSLGGQVPVLSEVSLWSGVAQTEWSWSPLLADFDHDGYRDLLITNGFPKDITDHDFSNYYNGVSGYLTDEMKLATTEKMPVVKVSNYAYRNRGDATFEDVTKKWGMDQPSFSNGAAYADFDGDGDLDYVVNNIGDEAFVYRNTLMDSHPEQAHYLRINFRGPAQNPAGLGAIVEYALPGGHREFYENTPYRGYLSSVEPVAHLGLGRETRIESLTVTWPGLDGSGGATQVLTNVKADQMITVDFAKSEKGKVRKGESVVKTLLHDVTDSLGITYWHEEQDFIDFNGQKTLLHKLSQYGPALATGDVNGDKLADVVIGGSAGRSATLLLQQANGRFATKTLPAKVQEDGGLLLFDADLDNDLDLFAVSGSIEFDPRQTAAPYRHRLYLNDGKGTFTLAPANLPGSLNQTGSCVKAADYDHDGDLDLFVGGRVEPNKYPKPVSSFVLQNNRGRFTDVTAQVAPALQNVGLVCDALWTDPDNDGWPDLLLATEWGPLMLLKNERGGKLQPTDNQLKNFPGFWNSLTPGDFDNDGDTDYLAGNFGINTLLRASDDRPVRVHAADFDDNGFFDAFPSVYFRNDQHEYAEYPYFGWDDMVRQMIGIKRRYVQYAALGKATITDILTPEEQKRALVLKATCLTSSYVENLGEGKFAVRPLPGPAQVAPLFGMAAQDVDGDGNLDALLVGNDFGAELVVGRMDALNGLVLRGDGKGRFAPMSLVQSGFYVPGDAKALVSLPGADGRCRWLVSENQGPLRAFGMGRTMTFQPVDTKTSAVSVRLANGKTRRTEVPFGSTFYGQSARGVWLGAGETIGK
jgi:enediyne biosynthesis protein E4